MDNKLTRHASYNINYHFVWIPKYRRPVLIDLVSKRLTELLYEKTAALNGEVFDLVVQPDHVHLFCSFPPTIAPYQIMHRLKGYTAHILRKEFPHLKTRLPNLWTRSYYIGTTGHVSAEIIKKYIETQKKGK